MSQVAESLKERITGLGHVGHIVADLEQALDWFRKVYGLEDDDIVRVPNPPGHDVITLFAFVQVGNTQFELIEPVSAEAKAQLLSMPSGLAGINHVAWYVDDIQRAVSDLRQQGIGPGHVTPAGPVDIGNKYICYLNPEDTGGLVVELMQMKATAGQ